MTTFKTPQKAIDLIKHFESLNDSDLSTIGLQPKMDPRGIWTRGYGQAILVNGKFLKGPENHDLAMTYTLDDEEEAQQLLIIDLQSRENSVNAQNLSINEIQFGALVSFVYNEGIGNFLSSNLLRRLRANTSIPAAIIETEFLKWDYCAGERLDGLRARRMTESVLFNTGELLFYKCHNGILAQV